MYGSRRNALRERVEALGVRGFDADAIASELLDEALQRAARTGRAFRAPTGRMIRARVCDSWRARERREKRERPRRGTPTGSVPAARTREERRAVRRQVVRALRKVGDSFPPNHLRAFATHWGRGGRGLRTLATLLGGSRTSWQRRLVAVLRRLRTAMAEEGLSAEDVDDPEVARALARVFARWRRSHP